MAKVNNRSKCYSNGEFVNVICYSDRDNLIIWEYTGKGNVKHYKAVDQL